MKIKAQFYEEYERKTRPKIPKCLFNTEIERLVGIVSPSRLTFELIKGNEDVFKFLKEQRKYENYMRSTNRQQWKSFYRSVRIERI